MNRSRLLGKRGDTVAGKSERLLSPYGGHFHVTPVSTTGKNIKLLRSLWIWDPFPVFNLSLASIRLPAASGCLAQSKLSPFTCLYMKNSDSLVCSHFLGPSIYRNQAPWTLGCHEPATHPCAFAPSSTNDNYLLGITLVYDQAFFLVCSLIVSQNCCS